MSYTAIIVEPRQHSALSFVLETFLKNLSEDWTFIIFHGNKNIDFINEIIYNNLAIHKDRIQLVNLNVDNLSINDYNSLFKYNKDFYNYIKTDIFMVFQTDTIIFEKYKHLINEFLHSDYVGAPWRDFLWNGSETVGNGGLSIRKKSKMLEIMEKNIINDWPDDAYFSCPLHMHINKPPLAEAMRFSVEEIYSAQSFGCHKPWNRNYGKKLYNEHEEVRNLYKYNDISLQ